MIVTDFFMTRDDGVNLYRTYSDAGFKIRKIVTDAPDEISNEELYDEAIDVEGSGNVYAETDIPVDDEIPPETALRILLGGDEDEAE